MPAYFTSTTSNFLSPLPVSCRTDPNGVTAASLAPVLFCLVQRSNLGIPGRVIRFMRLSLLYGVVNRHRYSPSRDFMCDPPLMMQNALPHYAIT